MIYALKAIELTVVLVFIVALSGSLYSYNDGWRGNKLDRLELSIIGLLSVSTITHIINLFR